MLEIRRVDPATTTDVDRLWEIYRTAWGSVDPSIAILSEAEYRAQFAGRPDATNRYEGYLATLDGATVGAGTLSLRLADNTHRCAPSVSTAPGYGGRGVGAALLDHLEQRAQALGCTVADAAAHESNAAAMALLRRAGYRANVVFVERRLSLPVPTHRLDALAAGSAPHLAPYRVALHAGPIPVAWLPGYCAVKNRLNLDAPHGDEELAVGGRTPAMVRAQDIELAAQGQERIVAVGLDPADGIVALSELIVPAAGDAIYQAATIVAPAARGHRLGLALKVAATRAAQERHPDRRHIATTNVEANAHMIAINDELGFVVHARIPELTKHL